MTDRVARGYALMGQPWTPAIPQPWEQQGYSPYEHRPRFDPDIEIEPGFYVLPEPGWGGDPGIVVRPPVAPPAVVDDPSVDAEPVEARGIEALDAGDHVAHGARSTVLPGIVGGVLAGALTAAAVPPHLSKARGVVFGGRALTAAASTVLTGAAAGLLVAASSPKDGDSLQARYAVAGGLLGAAGGAMFPGGLSRGASVVIGAAANAGMGWFIGNSLAKRVDGDGAPKEQDLAPGPVAPGPVAPGLPGFGAADGSVGMPA